MNFCYVQSNCFFFFVKIMLSTFWGSFLSFVWRKTCEWQIKISRFKTKFAFVFSVCAFFLVLLLKQNLLLYFQYVIFFFKLQIWFLYWLKLGNIMTNMFAQLRLMLLFFPRLFVITFALACSILKKGGYKLYKKKQAYWITSIYICRKFLC